MLALHDGDDDRACRLIACAQRIFEETESVPDPDDRIELDDAMERLQERLAARFRPLWSEGLALSIDQAQALARAE